MLLLLDVGPIIAIGRTTWSPVKTSPVLGNVRKERPVGSAQGIRCLQGSLNSGDIGLRHTVAIILELSVIRPWGQGVRKVQRLTTVNLNV